MDFRSEETEKIEKLKKQKNPLFKKREFFYSRGIIIVK